MKGHTAGEYHVGWKEETRREKKGWRDIGPVWQGFGSSKNSSGSDSSDGAAFLVELEPF